ncbi:aspartate/glutamate racemase family protein [Vreelandella indica]|jgi:allantoin racemase|uniref:aspartate/glutamate racemase family protein n=1 Tax=Vreelandella indica TaxID=3126500 RepID=UPI00300E1C5C|tara:strand:+ start:5570 stop:6256 length:687 start_codon:yes stop_codon:yes gene_type:complete
MNHHQKIVKDTPRFLIINPNTNNTVTDNIREVVHSISPPGVMTEVTSPPHGPYAIETEQDKAAATQQVLALIQRRNAEGFSGYIMACFDDIAIAEARILTQVPVISLAEAAIRHAAATGGQFTVITTFDEAVPTIASLSESYGLNMRCRVVATGIGVADTAAQTELAEARLHEAIQEAIRLNLTPIVLGSGAFAGRAKALRRRYNIDIVDGFIEALDYTLLQAQVVKN